MEVVEATKINSFAFHARQADFVPSSEEPVFILTASHLKALIKEAVSEVSRSLKDEIARLRGMLGTFEK